MVSGELLVASVTLQNIVTQVDGKEFSDKIAWNS